MTLSNFFKKTINSYRRYQLAKETINELSKLTNRELNDIGLARGDIWYIAHEDADKQFPEETAKPVDKIYANPNLRGYV